MRNNHTIQALACCLALVIASSVAASTVSRLLLTSEGLGEERPLNIVLPDGYSSSEEYPVVIALDGGDRYITRVASLMHEANPSLIVVGVENVDRSRDMFPDPVPERENRGGGGVKFLAFLVDELIPFIDAQYSTNGVRVLSGQSNSGFFVLFAMTQKPDAFDAWLASSPMIGWDLDLIHDGTTAMFESKPDLSASLYMNVGENDFENTTDFVPGFEKLLSETAPSGFRWKSDLVEGGNHVPVVGFRIGIEFIFGHSWEQKSAHPHLIHIQ